MSTATAFYAMVLIPTLAALAVAFLSACIMLAVVKRQRSKGVRKV